MWVESNQWGDRRLRVKLGRATMHEGAGAKCRLADRAAIEKKPGVLAQIEIHSRRQFHEQIVRMLPVDQRLAVRRLAGGEQVGIAAAVHRRFEAEHGFQLYPAPACFPCRHQHGHRGRIGLVVAARAGMVGVLRGNAAMSHQHPVAGHDVEAGHGALKCWQASGAGAFCGLRWQLARVSLAHFHPRRVPVHAGMVMFLGIGRQRKCAAPCCQQDQAHMD